MLMKHFSKILICFFCYINLPLSHAQNPLVKQWDKRYGGINVDAFTCILQTADGGYILGGDSYSDNDGDKTQPNWNSLYFDFWVVKTDSVGNIMWDKDLGGTKGEDLSSILESNDGGYLFCGSSGSDSTGNITQNAKGTTDFWVLKTDINGNILWDKRYGGSNTNKLNSADKTFDGGYILGGYSNSNISGDKSEPSWGDEDYWIIKIDSTGNKQWDKRFGGTASDVLMSLKRCKDGGYVLGGYSYSGISGDKTQPNFVGSFSYPDYWVIKIDSIGNKIWDKTFGGTGYDNLISVQQSSDEGFILGGISKSGISGNKTLPNWDPTNSTSDYWIIKTDLLGNKQWEKDYGGLGDELTFGNIAKTNDYGYLIAGISTSDIGGNKTENNLGYSQTWALKLDSVGSIEWDKTVLSDGSDAIGFGTQYGVSCLQSNDGCYLFTNYSSSGIGGDKTQGCWDTTNFFPDYWMVKFCDTTSLTNVISHIETSGLQISIYPNPFLTDISISVAGNKTGYVGITIYNALGETVYEQRTQQGNTNSRSVYASFLPKGIYLVEVIIDGERAVKKIIKE